MEYLSLLINWEKLFNRGTSSSQSPEVEESEKIQNNQPYTANSTHVALKEKLFKCLQELRDIEFSREVVYTIDALAEDALFIIFDVGKKRVNFTEKEKKLLGDLLADTIRRMMVHIRSAFYRFDGKLDNGLLIKRSALQFLIDNFGQFPAKGSILLNVLEEAYIKNGIELLDRIINSFYDEDDSDCFSDPEEVGASELPDTHTWWERGRFYDEDDSDCFSDREEVGASELPYTHTWWEK